MAIADGYGLRLKGDASGLIAAAEQSRSALGQVAQSITETASAATVATTATRSLGTTATAVSGAMAAAASDVSRVVATAGASTRAASTAAAALETTLTEGAANAASAIARTTAAILAQTEALQGAASQVSRGLATPSITAAPTANVQALVAANRAAAREALIASDGLEALVAASQAATRQADRQSAGATAAAAAASQQATAQQEVVQSTDRQSSSSEALQRAQAGQVASSGAVINGIRLQGHQLTNLSYQIQDIAVSLAGGMSPFMVMMQQIPQAAGAVGGFTTLFRLAFNPALLATAALAGAVALVGGRIAATETQTKSLTLAMRDLGTSGKQAASVLLTRSNDVADGSSYSRAEMNGATVAIARHRQLAQSLKVDLVGLSTAVATVTGGAIAETANALSDALEGGHDGITKLDASLGFLTLTESASIRTLTEHGRVLEAQKVAVAALNREYQAAAREGLSDFEKASNRLGSAWNKGLDSLAASFVAKTVWQGFKDMVAATGEAAANVEGWIANDSTASDVAALSQQIAAAQSQLADLRSIQPQNPAHQQLIEQQVSATRDLIARLESDIDRLTAKGRQAVAEAQQASTTALATVAQATDAAVLAGDKRVEALRQALSRKAEVLAAPAPLRDTVTARQAAEDYTRENSLNEQQGAQVQDLYAADAQTQRAAAVRDATDALRLQADAQTAVAAAAGQSDTAMRSAAAAAKIQAFAWQNNGVGVEEYAAQVWRAVGAETAMQRALWARQIIEQATAGERLAAAYQSGSAAAVKAAERENDIQAAIAKSGVTYDEAAAGVDRLRAARVDAARQIYDLGREVADAEALAAAQAQGPQVVRQVRIEQAVTQFANDNNATEAQTGQYRALRQRDEAGKLKETATETNRAYDAAVRYKGALAALEDQQAAGLLTAEAYNRSLRQLERERLEASDTFADGAKRAMLAYADTAGNAAKRAERFFSSSFSNMEDALVDFARTGKLNFADLTESILSDLYRMQVQANITAPLASLLSGSLGGLFGSSSGVQVYGGADVVGPYQPAAVRHGGGFADASGTRRAVDPGIFATAPRYHTGGIAGLRPNEVPSILEEGEEVLTAQDPRHSANLGRAGRGTLEASQVNIDIEIIDQRGGDQPAPQVRQSSGPDGRAILQILLPALRSDIAQRGGFSQVLEGAYSMNRKRGAV